MTERAVVPDGVELTRDIDRCGDIGGFVAQYRDVNGKRTRYYDEGDGFPIFMCHGGGWRGNHSANVFVPLMPHLVSDYRCIAADKLGSGLTDNPDTAGGYTVEAQVEHMTEFIRSFGYERFFLFGQSRGAYLAGRIAIENPDLVKGLVLANSNTLGPAVGDNAGRRAELFAGRGVADSGMAVSRDRNAFAAEVRWDYEMLSYNTDYISDEFIETAVAMEYTPKSIWGIEEFYRGGGREVFMDSLRAQKPETLERLRNGAVPCPTLILWGKDDPSAILPIGHELYDIMAQSNDRVRMIVMNRAGHAPFCEHPEEFAHYVRAFFEYEFGSSTQRA